MFRLLIVDDEKIILNGLRTLIEKRVRLPFEVDISVASSGMAALEMLPVFMPDLILTDIRMPVMDGFEFIQRVRAENVECDIAILTSHADFAYAKKAISFHVEEFLLKPIQVEELEKVLISSWKKREKSRNTERQECVEMLRNLLLYDLPAEQLPIDETLLREIFPHSYFTVILVEMESQEDYTQKLEEEISWFYPVCKTFRFYERKHYVTVCNHAQFFLDTKPLGFNIQKLFCTEAYYSSISISSNTWTKLHSLYMNAQLRILCRKMYQDKNELADISFITYRDCVDILTENDSARMEEKLEGYLSKILSQYPETARLMTEIGKSFVRNCNVYLENVGARPLEEPFGFENARDGRTLAAALKRLLEAYRMQNRERERQANEPSVVNRMVNYMESHYMEDISLESLAEAVGMHPNYLCTLFRKYRGETYLNCLQRIRIDAAKRLLEGAQEFTLEEIAAKTGCRSANQLIRSFKKLENMTPGEYRKRTE